MGPHPAVAAIRLAVRRVLHDLLTEHNRTTDVPAPGSRSPRPQAPAVTPVAAARVACDTARETAYDLPGPAQRAPRRTTPHERTPSPLVLVACSGGADSMALASALAFEAPKLGIRAGGITVDHGLQPGSDLRAEEVVLRLRELGLDPAESIAVTVGRGRADPVAHRDRRGRRGQRRRFL
ncbi:ATP-binding protein, partial [Streptomyces nigra]